jgi:hypothetical protein
MINIGMSEINTQRHSPSSPQEQAEPRLGAGAGLDVTACSASFDFGVDVSKIKDEDDKKWWMGELEKLTAIRNDQINNPSKNLTDALRVYSDYINKGEVNLPDSV